MLMHFCFNVVLKTREKVNFAKNLEDSFVSLKILLFVFSIQLGIKDFSSLNGRRALRGKISYAFTQFSSRQEGP
jgi:hypothetical protein